MRILPLVLLIPFAACTIGALPPSPPPLVDMEEPLDRRAEPDDEAARLQLPAGAFSGLVVEDARETLAAKLDEPSQLRIAQVVENSPAMAAGLQVDDLLLTAAVGDAKPVPLVHLSEWRRIELDTAPGTKVVLRVDRAGRDVDAALTLAVRVRPAARTPVETFREELRTGAVFRTATEVEARSANLPPGAGAVVIGLSRRSPWRSVGIRFGDLITAVDGTQVAHPQDLLTILRDPDRSRVQLTLARDHAFQTVDAPLSRRERNLEEVSIPLIYHYERERGATEWSAVLGLLQYRSTSAAWRFRLLWLITFGGGDADRLLEGGS